MDLTKCGGWWGLGPWLLPFKRLLQGVRVRCVSIFLLWDALILRASRRHHLLVLIGAIVLVGKLAWHLSRLRRPDCRAGSTRDVGCRLREGVRHIMFVARVGVFVHQCRTRLVRQGARDWHCRSVVVGLSMIGSLEATCVELLHVTCRLVLSSCVLASTLLVVR